MNIGRNYSLCSHCLEVVKEKGSPLVDLLLDLFETFSIINQPVAISVDSKKEPILDYLENNGYIVTTEIPDPGSKESDILLVLPLGYLKITEEFYFFCFSKDRHK